MINAPVTKVETTVKATISNQSSGATADITNSQTIIACTVQNGVRGAKGDAGLDGNDGQDGHSPVLTWSGDKIAIDGVASGPSLTGPAGPAGVNGSDGADGSPGQDGNSPTLAWVNDQISIDGVVSGPHLTGPQGPQGIQGLSGADGVDGAKGDKGDTGAKGDPGDQHVFVQSSQPNFNGLTGMWLQTGMANDGFTIWFEDGE